MLKFLKNILKGFCDSKSYEDLRQYQLLPAEAFNDQSFKSLYKTVNPNPSNGYYLNYNENGTTTVECRYSNLNPYYTICYCQTDLSFTALNFGSQSIDCTGIMYITEDYGPWKEGIYLQCGGEWYYEDGDIISMSCDTVKMIIQSIIAKKCDTQIIIG